MSELNREQIIKALECCTRGRKSNEDRPCLECPYNECNIVGGTSERQIKGTCQGWLMKDALSLTNSQEQRIKELEVENVQFRHKQEKLIEERDVYKTWAYNKNALINSMTDKIESGYEPSAARACAEAEMWQRIALREKELAEDNERLRAELKGANKDKQILFDEIASLEAEAEKAIDIAEGNIRAEIASGGTSCHWCEDKVKADTVRKMQDRFNEVFDGMDATQALLRRTFDHIVKEMLEDT